LDAHYTPKPLAAALVGSAGDLTPTLIADLAAGEGDLLLEAEQVWPDAQFVATDIDRVALRGLRQMRSNWMLGECDLRNPRSRARCRALNQIRGAVSLLLLNPPFSCRGGTRFPVVTPTGCVYASTAMAFLLIASGYVSETGDIVAILPSGSLYSRKDAQAWSYVKTKYQVSVVGHYGKDSFPGSAASTTLVRLSPRRTGTPVTGRTAQGSRLSVPRLRVQVIRGCCPLYRAKRESSQPTLVHYTDLRDARVHLNGRRGFGAYRCITGPAVLIPRVGRITAGKIAFFAGTQRVMISDCVIALKTASRSVAHQVRDRLVNNLRVFSAYYVGTGAPFITLDRLAAVLDCLGIDSDVS
jgi:hypothetical protein